MTRKIALTAASATAALLLSASPALAWSKNKWYHTHYCNCGHQAGSNSCGSTGSSSGSTTTSGGSTGGSTTTSGGSTTTGGSGGHPVPEPGMLGMMGLGFIGLAAARRRRPRR
ncbi:hypothetical protein B2G71_18005 [Novosphingobium sp. PC22D]|uniref:PEP-CTERM sorting domain-containing protein n=1 Tax=Novosphingobium sp. PC22D TaxID=1962403 RepID=UPI000BEF77EC|nr:PEP-CTERM sorting domain-containing protein [Novosphingobium sp. PC22D]PEQ11185.1 hypothetical protein B2G71_18005 [Novosphingobium sp. PC22D]